MDNLKIRDFKEHGYRIYPPGLEKEWAWKLLQKKIVDKNRNTKYFINVFVSDYRLWDFYHKMGNPRIKRHYTVKLYLYKGTRDFTVSISDNWTDVGEIEAICEEIWRNLNMDLDHHN